MAQKIRPPKEQWAVGSGGITKVVMAHDQWEAFDVFSTMQVGSFGLVVSTIRVGAEQDEMVSVRTSLLMYRWGRVVDGHMFIMAAVKKGFPDTSALDMQSFRVLDAEYSS